MSDTYPKYIPLRKLKGPPYYGPATTKAYALIAERKLEAVRTPWGTMVTGESFAQLMASMPKFESKENPSIQRSGDRNVHLKQ